MITQEYIYKVKKKCESNTIRPVAVHCSTYYFKGISFKAVRRPACKRSATKLRSNFLQSHAGVTSVILNTDNTINIRLESGPMYFLFEKIRYSSHGYVSERALDRIERLSIFIFVDYKSLITFASLFDNEFKIRLTDLIRSVRRSIIDCSSLAFM